ncbi:hypothetical protein SEA_TWONLO_42 [Gordonia phage Twonlo]|uniref:Uncharacterized protein n=3 Tax=Dexdertvirus TaxID=2948679 RepID=A0A0K0MWG6_9CAUD|nr:hypothetical protein AU100_gp44 [Gordonia phage GTE6]YP_010001507.1 hypothetical protein J1598_gp45 [Gordonia phage Tiamoceli]QDF19627.1 hypothetical protein SEA_ROADKILL_42 [Gordonia Terrae phage RoadKill]QOI66788.1 hypothetical protein SEA_TWONLO_42 [Gordonia phage Twonlo]QWY80239.1 hypothetical protein SEA_EDMUNDFERRY_43 [Gordonia phage EdmundFerry]WNO27346.1 hypothetical protein SEA_KWEKEL_44 [Gordonia phage Kwekel]AKI28686.1 hypothetical protein GTE6_44 [Gordonia phage GTE6]
MIKRKATAYCDALGCPVNQTVLMNDREDTESQLRRIGWAVQRDTGRSYCPHHLPPAKDNDQ